MMCKGILKLLFVSRLVKCVGICDELENKLLILRVRPFWSRSPVRLHLAIVEHPNADDWDSPLNPWTLFLVLGNQNTASFELQIRRGGIIGF